MRRLLPLLAALALAGCADDPQKADSGEPPPEEPRGLDPEPDKEATVEKPRCPADLAGCESARGRILYVEEVDPDGDGDAHFVLASSESITGPGISVIDVRKDLRPDPLPGVGDEIGAAGPVHTGSYGQKQIEAVEVRVGER